MGLRLLLQIRFVRFRLFVCLSGYLADLIARYLFISHSHVPLPLYSLAVFYPVILILRWGLFYAPYFRL